jgi:DNA-directed RNA polymerase specialized sigma24 family protein
MSVVDERRADRTIERDYTELRGPVLRALRGKLRARGVDVDPADLDGFYNQAWHALYEKLREGEAVENPTAFLTQVAFFRAIDDYRQLHVDRRAGDDALPPDGLDGLATEPDLASALDDTRSLQAFIEGMKDRLTPTECSAATLCYLHGMTRPEAAEALGVSPKRMQKIMDGVSKKVGVLTEEIQAGRWCESRTSLMKAYALGLLDPAGERHVLAAAHLRECSACRRYVLSLRGLGAIAPPVALPLVVVAGATGGAAAGGGAGAAGGKGASRTGRNAAVAGAVAAVVAAAVLAAVLVTGGSDDDRPAAAASAPASASPSSSSSSSSSASAQQAAAAKAAKAKAAKARAAKEAAAAKARARKRRAARAKARAAAEARAAEQAAAATPAATPEPTPTPDPEPVATPTPEPVATPEPAREAPPEKVTTDAAQEFGVEAG